MFPKIKFKIDPNKDVNTFFNFLNESKYDLGRNYNWAILKKYPYFKKFGHDINKEIVVDFVLDNYKKNSVKNKKNIILIEKNWRMVEKRFFELTSDLFLETKWPKGKYIAYSTIWGMYPRFLQDKTFQIPLTCKNKKETNLIIAHEMLHFMFFLSGMSLKYLIP